MSGVTSSAPRLVSTTLPGPAGGLEALLRIPPTPRGAAVVAHPHPLHGGTMHTKVVHRTARLLSDRFGLAALRFNFRGVGASAGVHDGGRGEVEDLMAASRAVREDFPQGPFLLAGFSFGSLCAFRTALRSEPDLLVLIGLPINQLPEGSEPARELEASLACPVVWIQGDEDSFSDPVRAREIATRKAWDFATVPGADHFFNNRLEEFERLAFGMLDPLVGSLERSLS